MSFNYRIKSEYLDDFRIPFSFRLLELRNTFDGTRKLYGMDYEHAVHSIIFCNTFRTHFIHEGLLFTDTHSN